MPFAVAGLCPHLFFAQSSLVLLGPSGSETPRTAAEYRGSTKNAPALLPAKSPAVSGIVAPGTRKLVTSTVRVIAPADATDTDEGYERRIGTQEVEQSSGTFGDPMRFMQMLPGVVSDNDERNDFLVRGGNPSETLFVVDNIEIPSINQLALSDTTGGFVSMIDNAAVQHTTLHTDAYDSRFDQRLSAVVEMSTRPEGPVGYHARSEFGIGGTGGSIERPLGNDGSMFVSVRRSVLNWFTDDIGMNGVPIYTNALVRADRRVDEKNNWWGLSLTGIDSMLIHPDTGDDFETNPFIIQYSGWRNTTGINWEHIFSAKSFAILSVSNSEQQQTINQTAQVLGELLGQHRSHELQRTAADRGPKPVQLGPHPRGCDVDSPRIYACVFRRVCAACGRIAPRHEGGRRRTRLPMVDRRKHRGHRQGSVLCAPIRQNGPSGLCRVCAASCVALPAGV